MVSPIQVEREAKKSVGTALVVASNFRVVDLLLRAFKDMDVAVTNTVRIRDSMDLIHGRKFEAFALDAELDNEHLDLLAEVRSSSSNNTAVIVSVVPPGPMGETARKSGANFILEQPLTQDTVSRTLKVATV